VSQLLTLAHATIEMVSNTIGPAAMKTIPEAVVLLYTKNQMTYEPRAYSSTHRQFVATYTQDKQVFVPETPLLVQEFKLDNNI